jgi:hypothetical protein
VKIVTAVIVLTVFSVVMLLPFLLGTQPVSAQETSYTIQRVDHEVEVMYSGQVIIRDTISISGQLTGDFLIGFPYKYGSYVLKGVAYDEDNVFPVSLGVQLADRSGFYGAKISFPQGAPQVFTVALILSNRLLTLDSSAGMYSLDFPAYPSFLTGVAQCHVDLVFPETPSSITVTKDDGEVSTTSFVRQNLPAFTYSPALANFSLASGSLQIINIKELNRQITISPTGEISSFDSYRITNNSPDSLGYLEVGLPLDASNFVVRDEFGRILTADVLSSSGNTRLVNVTFISSIATSISTKLTAEYDLPKISEQIPHFTLSFNLFPDFNYYVETGTVTVVPPEGARFLTPQLSSIGPSSSLMRETFQETLSVSRKGVSKLDYDVPSEDVLQIAYDYNPLWLSFRPAVWMWTLAVVGCVVVAVWRRPKTSAPLRIAAPQASVVLSPDHVKAFTEAYDDKTRINSELKALEVRAQKGRIPRRRYKVQKRSLEVRLDGISKNIADLKKTFRSAGGVYANLVRQLDIAETELVEVEADIKAVEVRHRRGELPLEAYKKSLAAYERRKEKAEASINGILLRIREEIR